MTTIAIIGYGYVGKGMHQLFGDSIAAIKDPGQRDDGWDVVNSCDMAIIAVPTPMLDDGACDTNIVEEVAAKTTTPIVLVKSTVPPGTIDKLNEAFGERFVFSPEYMGEGGYFIPPWKYPSPDNPAMHTFHIFGGPRELTRRLVDIYLPICGPHVTYMQTNARTAEMVKYMENAWLATKVTWANEMYNICEAMDIDYREARELWALDSRVEKTHTAVFVNKRGFGGKCLPKDVNALIHASQQVHYEPEFMKAVIAVNDSIRGG